MEFKDYYKILGVKPDADIKEIKASYRKLARQYHPDKNAAKNAEEKFKEVAEAYQVLKNEKTRAEFDELRQYGTQSQQGFRPPPGWQSSSRSSYQGDSGFNGDYSDFFNSIFGRQKQSQSRSGFGQTKRRSKGQDIETELSVSLEETLQDTQKTVEFQLPRDAGASKKHLKVKVPQGVVDGTKIRLKGQGSPGIHGGDAGDLYLYIRVAPHPLFEVSERNLSITVPLTPWEAALGTKVTVPTLDGKITLTIAPNTQNGHKLRLKGKGLTSKTEKGDLFAIIKIVMPKNTTEKAKQLWQDLALEQAFNPREAWAVH